MNKEELLGKIIETKDGQKWFVVKLDGKHMAFNQNGCLCLDEKQPKKHKIVKVFIVKETDFAMVDDVLECIWEK